MSTDDDAPYDITHSIILDYYKIFQRTKWLVGSATVSGVIILLATIYFVYLSPGILNLHAEPRIVALFVLIFSAFFGISVWLIIDSVPLLSWYVFGGRKKRKELLHLQSQIIRRSYVSNFETVSAEGDTPIERIFNHLSLVFPQIYEIKKKNKTIDFDARKKRLQRRFSILKDLDLALKTPTGLFLIKIFENKSKFSNIENMVKYLNRKQMEFKIFGPFEIARVIVVLLEYDEYFETTEFKERMKNLERRFSLDIVCEDEGLGYSTVWLD